MPGLYVHFPFCASKCIYCDFYARVRKDWKPYVEALLQEIRERASALSVPPTTLYFGGGTPSLLPARLLARVADACRESFRVQAFEEFTVEVNPDDVTPALAASLREMGVSRVSMGVQSFDDAQLRWMRRRHTAAQAEAACATLRRAGCDNLSLDLIFGFQGLSDAGFTLDSRLDEFYRSYMKDEAWRCKMIDGINLVFAENLVGKPLIGQLRLIEPEVLI